MSFAVTYPAAYDRNLDAAGDYFQGGFSAFVIFNGNEVVSYISDGELPESAPAAAIKKAL